MRLTQVCLRKRKMNIKPEAFMRNKDWNNLWYLGQERPVVNIGFKEALEQRGVPSYKPDELLSPLHENNRSDHVETVETRMKKLPKDENHPLWQTNAAYTYNDSTWLPKNCQMQFASAITNSVTVHSVPERISNSLAQFSLPPETQYRMETLVKNAYIGDAVQKLLPRNFRVPYIGWDPVESKMRPRNLYDHTKNTWGRTMPREYGVPNTRKLLNLNRGIFMETIKLARDGAQLMSSVETEAHRQLVTRPDGKLVRLNLAVPLSVYGRKPLPPHVDTAKLQTLDATSVASVAPLDPVASLHPTNVYHPSSAHPISSTLHSHPFAHTVFTHYTTHIDPKWNEQAQLARSLMVGFTVSLGQARLRWGEDVKGDLKEPVCINLITTDGQRYQIGSFQLNTMDLDSEVKNVFWQSPDTQNLFEFCGYKEAQPMLDGLNMQLFNQLQCVLADGMSQS